MNVCRHCTCKKAVVIAPFVPIVIELVDLFLFSADKLNILMNVCVSLFVYHTKRKSYHDVFTIETQ